MFCVHESNSGYKITVISVFLTVLQRKHLLNIQETIKNFKSHWRVPAVTLTHHQSLIALEATGLLSPKAGETRGPVYSIRIVAKEKLLPTHEIRALIFLPAIRASETDRLSDITNFLKASIHNTVRFHYQAIKSGF